MSDVIKCPKCGADNPTINKFCDTCGSKLEIKQQVKKIQEKPVEKKKVEPQKPIEKPEKKEKHVEVIEREIYEQETADISFLQKSIVINWEIIAWIAIVIMAVCLRFFDIGAKPLHHDESMHAFYSWKLFKGEGYSYNPMMHGPFQFHITALMYYLFGTSDYTCRIAPAIYGMLCVIIMWWFKPYLGRVGALLAALIFAISPGFVYQSRFIREDIFFAGNNLILVIGLLRYFDTRKLNWLIIAAIGLALSWATKETVYITGFIFFTFLFGRWIWEYSLRHIPEKFEQEGNLYRTIEWWLGKGKSDFINAFLVFFFIHAILFFNKEPGMSFFANLKGIPAGYIDAITYWLGQHGVERGSQPMYFYALLIPYYELLSVVFMLVATFYYLIKPEKRTFFNIFCIYWWFMAMLIYSWAGERMPWLMLHPLIPMHLLAAKFFAELIERIDWGWKRTVGITIFILLAMNSFHGAVYVSFYGYGADPKESLVYVQSSPDVLLVTEKIKKFAKAIKSQKWDSESFRKFNPYDLEIVCEDYCTWPFAWYLREFNRIAYQPKNIPEYEKGKPLILSGIEEANRGHDQRVFDLLKDEYYYERYKLREWWAPDEGKFWSAPLGEKINMLWRRFIYRDVWNDLGSYDFVVYVRKDLKEFWQQ
ncbi:MAG: TIGR03663 family protein [Candidatus Goldbacteria bacterium]|nr:TIGR03663 family protein [Candidatus Goldiibacteriota bacterium]